MWVHINTLAKTIVFFPHKIKVEIVHKSNPTKTSTIIVEKNRKFAILIILHNRIQNSEKFSPIVTQKLAFPQVPQQLFYKQA